MKRLASVLAELRAAIAAADLAELPPIVGQLAALDAEMKLRIATAPNSSVDPAPSMPGFLTPKQAGEMLNYSVGGVYRLMQSGALPVVTFGERGSKRIPLAALHEMARRQIEERDDER